MYKRQVLDYALLSAPGAPLKQALLDAGIGKDIYGDYSDGVLQPYFSVIAKGARAARKEEFVSIIRNCLQDIVKNGIDKKAVLSGINYMEFRYREADFGQFPNCLLYTSFLKKVKLTTLVLNLKLERAIFLEKQ